MPSPKQLYKFTVTQLNGQPIVQYLELTPGEMETTVQNFKHIEDYTSIEAKRIDIIGVHKVMKLERGWQNV